MNFLLAFLFLVQQIPDSLPVDSLPLDTVEVVKIVRPASPTDVAATDAPNDGGGAIMIQWQISADDGAGLNNIIIYNVFRGSSEEGPFDYIGSVGAGKTQYGDGTVEENGITYFYMVKAQTKDGAESDASNVASAKACAQWFHRGRLNILIFGIIFTLFFFIYMQLAKGKKLFIRKIAGLDAVEEAVGRSTEMGKPVLFCPGIGYLSDIATIAALTILGRVAKKTAE